MRCGFDAVLMRKACPGRPNDRTPGDSGDWRQTGGSRGHHDRYDHVARSASTFVMVSTLSLLLPLLLFAGCASALDAKWTPAADGGPARFSKRYRDAQGIDDSRWGGGDSASSRVSEALVSVFPDSAGGWAIALLASAVLFVLMRQPSPAGRAMPVGGPGPFGGPVGGSHGPRLSAADAAREAALKRHS